METIKTLSKQSLRNISPETAVALITVCSLSQDDFQKIRNLRKAHGANIFPPYSKVLAAKKECYTNNSNINETPVEQPLQDLLDHTAKRLLEIDCVKESINWLIDPNCCDQTMN
ncbi:unnamed protein product [Brachionus calyciflorus]|uniref:Uncharacterized protein n=1 Tax=Brachionus calyciflorus TaxID=104777 RepID=A0A814PH44_9BILA|nr:unnamed protein product [Brachionus calyciflorus]